MGWIILNALPVHPDGSVWAGGEGGQIYRISSDGAKVEEVNNTKGFILGIAFSPDASWLAVCDLKNKCVWKLTLSNNKLEKFATGAEVKISTFRIMQSFQGLENYLLLKAAHSEK
jgi:sugar lactone lactonase YvrE